MGFSVKNGGYVKIVLMIVKKSKRYFGKTHYLCSEIYAK